MLQDKSRRSFNLIWLERLLPTALIAMTAALGSVQTPSVARSRSFQPVSKLTTWYTNRAPIDIEIAASAGQGDEAHWIEPERTLRFRLERAYVESLSRTERPAYNSILLTFDLQTGLPSALFKVPPEQVEVRNDPIRQLSNDEWGHRTLILLLQSNFSSDVVPRVSSELNRCKGVKLQSDLFLYDKDRDHSCLTRSLGFGKKYVAQLSEETSLLINCSDSLVGCKMYFPFEGFLPSVSFHESHLIHWKEIMEKATGFLRSRQYRGGE
jgi:hypothetical protein